MVGTIAAAIVIVPTISALTVQMLNIFSSDFEWSKQDGQLFKIQTIQQLTYIEPFKVRTC